MACNIATDNCITKKSMPDDGSWNSIEITKIGPRLSVCMGCAGPINDQYILRVAPDMEWHAACLKCAECHQFLDETCTCFVRDGKTFCKRDYVRLFGAKCDKCNGFFTREDMVMRARSKIFHLNCFRCSICQKQLMPGDEFALRDGYLYCRHDYDSMKDEGRDEEMVDDNHNTDIGCPVELAEEPELASQEAPSRPSTGESTPCSGPGDGNGPGGGEEGSGIPEEGNVEGSRGTVNRNGSSRSNDRVIGGAVEKLTFLSGSNGSGGGGISKRESSGRIHKNEGKPTRVRTVLTEKQLQTLKTCYNANPRPDALMKEQLVEMTGLSPRVIRVWFQNKRCKDKKRAIFMKQVVLQQEKGGRFGVYGSMQGVPLVASPPSHNEPQSVPFEVTAYQPPWKTLAEFALTHDLDRLDPSNPQYQHVIKQMHGYGIEHESVTAHIGHLTHPQHQQPPYTPMDESGEMSLSVASFIHQGGTSLTPTAHFPGTPSELSSTSSE